MALIALGVQQGMMVINHEKNLAHHIAAFSFFSRPRHSSAVPYSRVCVAHFGVRSGLDISM